jgi:integrase
MPRSARSSKLETRTSRLKLPVAKKPTFVRIGRGVALGYRRNQTAGTWVLRVADGKGGHWSKRLADADDLQIADGGKVLDFWQAQERARTLARASDEDDADAGKLITVKEAVDRYEAELKARGGDPANAARIRVHLPDALSEKTVALLAARDFRPWRAALARKELSPAAINRANSCFKACLNLAADQDERINNHRAWEKGLSSIPDAVEPRNVILAETTVRKIVDSAYRNVGVEFGLLTEVAAVTGARVSQLARLEAQDVQGDRKDPRLMMPSSRKGRGQKKVTRRPVQISANLADRLLLAAKGRPGAAPLLTKLSGEQWKRSDHTRLFARAVKLADVGESELPASLPTTIYALRHSSIVRQLLNGVPVRVVAVNHDTSVTMIERTYSRYISDHSDSLSRKGMLDLDPPNVAGATVTPIRGARHA